MNNIQTKIKKLLLAFRTKGIIYKINTYQFYSEKQQKVLQKMILWLENPKKDGAIFFNKVELLKYLTDKWKEVNNLDNRSG